MGFFVLVASQLRKTLAAAWLFFAQPLISKDDKLCTGFIDKVKYRFIFYT
jgi:hypothetical protein